MRHRPGPGSETWRWFREASREASPNTAIDRRACRHPRRGRSPTPASPCRTTRPTLFARRGRRPAWSSRRSLGKHQLDLHAQLPFGAALGFLDVVVGADLRVHGKLPDMEDVTDAAADGNGPTVAAIRLPVRRDQRGRREIRAAGQVVVDERLHEQVAVTGAVTSAHRPDVVHQHAVDPWTFRIEM